MSKAAAVAKKYTPPKASVQQGKKAAASQPQPRTAAAAKVKSAAYPITNKYKHMYEDDDDEDDYSDESDSSDFSDNSEEYRPLAFDVFKGGADRRCGGPSKERLSSMKLSGKELESSDDDDVPLLAQTEKNGARRHYGKGEFDLVHASTSLKSMNESDYPSSAKPLPISLEGRKRARSAVHVPLDGPQVEICESEALSSDADDEVPMNAQLILNLVHRLRKDPLDDIPLEAFQCVNWDDENFQRELAPLKKIYEYLEAKSHSVQSVKSNAIRNCSTRAADKQVKEALMALPAEQAISAKVGTVRNVALRTGGATGNSYESGSAEQGIQPVNPVTQKGTQKTIRAGNGATEGKNANTEEQNPNASKEDVNVANRELKLANRSAPESGKATTGKATTKENALPRGAGTPSPAVKAAEMHIPEGEVNDVRSKGISSTHAAKRGSVAEMCAPSCEVEKQKDGVLAPAAPKKKKKSKEGRLSASSSQVYRMDGNAIVSQAPSTKPKEEIIFEEAKKPRRSVKKQHNNRSMTFSEVLTPEAGIEIVETDSGLPTASGGSTQPILAEAEGLRATASGDRDPAAVANRQLQLKKKRQQERRKGKQPGRSVSFTDLPEEEAAELVENNKDIGLSEEKHRPAPKRSKRNAAKRNNGRSCSFSDIELDNGGEIREDDKELEGGPFTSVSSAHQRPLLTGATSQRPSLTTQQGSTRERSMTVPARTVPLRSAAAAPVKIVPKKAARRRRPGENSHGSLEFGAVDDEAPGELTEEGVSLNRGADGGQQPDAKRRARKKGPLGRSREISMSQLADDTPGEIVENNNDLEYLGQKEGPQSSATQRPWLAKTAPTRIPPKPASPGQTQAVELLMTEPKSAEKSASPVDSRLEPSPARPAMSATRPKMRRSRKRVSHELSISALPDDEVGEIQEGNVDSLEDPSTRSSRNQLPRIGSGVNRSGNTPSLRRSNNNIMVAIPSTEGKFIQDSIDPNIPPPRRVSQSVPNASSPATTLPKAMNGAKAPPPAAAATKSKTSVPVRYSGGPIPPKKPAAAPSGAAASVPLKPKAQPAATARPSVPKK